MNDTPTHPKSVDCEKCGESLVGQVNSCWKCGHDVVIRKTGIADADSPFGNEQMPIDRSDDRTERADEAMAKAASLAAILIGLFSLPFSNWLGLVVVPAAIGLCMAFWGLTASRNKRRAIAGILICLVALSLAGRIMYADVSNWYEETFVTSQF